MNQQYTIVLPIKINAHNHDNLKRFIQIQLRSLNKFLDIYSLHEFLIICKENEENIIRKELEKYPSPLPIRLVTEDTLIKKEVIGKISGWYLQQLIKIGVSKIVRTKLYLVLDADCFLTKKFWYENLFYQEKILINTESWMVHPEWWLASAEIINEVSLSKLANKPVISVTPQILITNVVWELVDYLNEKKKPLRWDEYLSNNLFTEFTLYWLFLHKKNRIDMYQISGGWPLLLGNAIWRSPWGKEKWWTLNWLMKNIFSRNHRKSNKLKKQIISQHIKTSFESNDYFYFSLIQSNIKDISLESLIKETDKYLN